MGKDEDRDEWFRQQGIELDEDGLPQAKLGPNARGICSRCKAVCEHPTEASMHLKGQDKEVQLCLNCHKLSMTDTPRFFREGW